MTKKELETKVEELREEVGKLRYKEEMYGETNEELERLKGVLSEVQTEKRIELDLLANHVKNLTLRLDILTLTPEQIETMRKVKASGRIDEPLNFQDQMDKIGYRPRK